MSEHLFKKVQIPSLPQFSHVIQCFRQIISVSLILFDKTFPEAHVIRVKRPVFTRATQKRAIVAFVRQVVRAYDSITTRFPFRNLAKDLKPITVLVLLNRGKIKCMYVAIIIRYRE